MAHSLLLVDDHVLFREGMRSVMSHWDDIQVVGEAANGEEAVRMAHQLAPDLVLMDITMPVMDGIAATRRILQDLPATRVVMLTMSDDDGDLFEAIRSGASGYVLKNMPQRRLHDELRGVLRGEAPLSGPVAAKLLREFSVIPPHPDPAPQNPTPQGIGDRGSSEESKMGAAELHRDESEHVGRPSWTGRADALTERERQVLQLLADGFSNQDIARRICLSENTVKKHLHNILQKLHLNNRVEAAMYAVRHGLASQP